MTMRPGDTSGYGVEPPVDLTRIAGRTPAEQPAAAPAAGPPPAVDPAGLAAHPPPVTSDPAQWGWRAGVRRLSGGLITLRPGPLEARHRLAEVAVRQYIGGPRLVMVANPKGGARVSTTTLLLAHTLAALRGGSVVAWDNAESRGTLGDRAEVTTPATTVWHLLGAFEHLAGTAGAAGDMSHYLRSQPSGAEVLAADTDPRRREQIGAADCGRLAVLLSRHYRLAVMDTGNNVRASNWLWAAHSADVLVVPITLDPDIAQAAAWMLDVLVGRGRADLVAGAVTLISPGSVAPPAAVRARMLDYFAARTAVLVEVPHDPQLAGGRPVVFERITVASRRAWVAAAAAVADRLAAVRSARPDELPGPPPPAPNPVPGPAGPAASGAPPPTGDGAGGQASVTALPVRRAQAQ
jgi:MinD-like ATPase involved in chromosome partitioning or flagellar assembly